MRALAEAGADARTGNDYGVAPLDEARLQAGAKLGGNKPALLEAAKTPEMRALLEAAE